MKKFYLRVFFLCSIVSTSIVQAQQPNLYREPDHNRQKIFQQLPDSLIFQPERLVELLERKIGEKVQVPVGIESKLVLTGQVVSITNKYDGRIQSIVIRTNENPDIMILFSRIVSDNGEIIYRGYLRGKESGDLYVAANLTGKWQWIRKGFYDVINE